MISLIIKISFVIFFNLLFFILYPDTGKYGSFYLWTSISLWSIFFLYLSSSTKLLKLFIFPFNLWLYPFVYGIMIFFILITMPQSDKILVIKKISKGQWPSAEEIKRGKIKYLNEILPNKILKRYK